MEKKYFGNWSNYTSMKKDWGDFGDKLFPTEDEVIFALYGLAHYQGEALVIFKHGNTLYFTQGSHCSCYELSESGYSGRPNSQWSPEKTSWAALSQRRMGADEYGAMEYCVEGISAWKELIASHLN